MVMIILSQVKIICLLAHCFMNVFCSIPDENGKMIASLFIMMLSIITADSVMRVSVLDSSVSFNMALSIYRFIYCNKNIQVNVNDIKIVV